MKSRVTAAVVLIAAALAPAGCVVGSKNTVSTTGRPISENTLDILEPGVTTERQLLDLLGEPTRVMNEDEVGGKVYVYEYERRKSGRGYILFAYAGSSESVEQRTLYVKIRDGAIERFWVDAA